MPVVRDDVCPLEVRLFLKPDFSPVGSAPTGSPANKAKPDFRLPNCQPPKNLSHDRIMLTDTHPDAEAVQFELLRRMTSAQKFETACALTEMVIDQARRAIERRFPNASSREVDLKFIALHYGADLADNVRVYLKERGDG